MKNCQVIRRIHRIELGCISPPMVFWVALSNVPILMSGFLIHLLHPTAKPTFLPAIKKHEWEKRCAYGQRIQNMEHSIFTPLVLSATGSMANEASIFYKRLAFLLPAKWDHSYFSTLCWLHCRLAFSLLRSFIQVIRGARSSRGQAI